MVNGEGQQWNPDEYDRTARFVSDLGEDALALLNPLRGEQILDLGCGDGVLTERIIQAGSRVVALDSSADQVSAACKRGVDARVGDATSLEFRDEFDAVFSNAALHWIRDHDAVLAGVYRALRPAGTDETCVIQTKHTVLNKPFVWHLLPPSTGAVSTVSLAILGTFPVCWTTRSVSRGTVSQSTLLNSLTGPHGLLET